MYVLSIVSRRFKHETYFISCNRGIAAYKAIDLTSKLTQSGYEVRVMLSDNAQEFVTPLAFQAISRNPVYTNTFKEETPQEIQHVSLETGQMQSLLHLQLQILLLN